MKIAKCQPAASQMPARCRPNDSQTLTICCSCNSCDEQRVEIFRSMGNCLAPAAAGASAAQAPAASAGDPLKEFRGRTPAQLRTLEPDAASRLRALLKRFQHADPPHTSDGHPPVDAVTAPQA